MFKLNVVSHFSAAHKLNGYDGECKNLHGHNWKIRVGINCEETDQIGMAIDFGVIKEKLNKEVDKLDHKYLNELPSFSEINPTSENIAKTLFEKLSKSLNINDCVVSEVEVWESERASVIYYKKVK